jgi:hypothetical protein
MASNEIFKDAEQLQLTVGASVAARTPMVVSDLPVMTLTATGSSGTTVATCLLKGVVEVSVHGYGASANAAVAQGDIIYYDSTELNVDSSNGVRWGYALEAVTSGDTATIRCKIGY